MAKLELLGRGELTNYFVRISIGTESFDDIRHAIQHLCLFLQQTNTVIEKYHQSAKEHKQKVENPTYTQACLTEITAISETILSHFDALKQIEPEQQPSSLSLS